MTISELIEHRALTLQRIAEAKSDLENTENEIKTYLIEHRMFSYLSVNYGRLFRHNNPKTTVPKPDSWESST